MTKQFFEDLAKLYGIEINTVESGKGGLFYTTSNEEKMELNLTLTIDKYMTPQLEILPFLECNTFSNYLEEDLMNQAA
ncbi:hypothetical protein [uncultured Bacteroides sp.]|uniref:hypothetical protein n=1 Tax=uncultured Bacteroides sp. TaxID=162156 RepID=UPI002631C5D5|nr:hypothetical protein [uncultured Bacteroides sp.]